MSAALKFDYSQTDDNSALRLVKTVRGGMPYSEFEKIAAQLPFAFAEWPRLLHLSDRSMQRYKKEQKTFDSIQTERIISIVMLYNKGLDVFEEKARFDVWLSAKNVALGGIEPKSLLDSTFGIGYLKDELGRIEHGILA